MCQLSYEQSKEADCDDCSESVTGADCYKRSTFQILRNRFFMAITNSNLEVCNYEMHPILHPIRGG